MRDTVEIGDKVIGTFEPLRSDDLTDGVPEWVGTRITWYAAWEIEEGSYKGQIAMTPFELTDLPPIGWVPLCDLKEIESA